MKILLLGEFSGVNTSIYRYLSSKGYQVLFLAEQDGWKDYKGESFFYKFGRSKWVYIVNLVYVILNFKRLINYDYVLFLTPNFPGKLYFFSGIYHLILKFNKKVIYYACGSDYGYVKMQSFSEYSPYVQGGELKPQFSRVDKLLFRFFTKRVSVIYSSSPDYASYFYNYNYSNYGGHKNLPLTFEDFNNVNDLINAKSKNVIKIFHPISRPKFKGTPFILEALKRIENIPGLDIVVVERVSLNELKSHLLTTDILIDQCMGFGFGILATLGMRFNCIVLTGFRDKNFCNHHPGIYNIDPDVDQISNLLTSLINLPFNEFRNRQVSSFKYIDELKINSIKDVFT